MTKIKIVGIFVFMLSISLAILSNYISHENKINNKLLNTINAQKAFTQEISKNIFYIYKNKNASPKQLDNSIKRFLENLTKKDQLLNPIDSVDIRKKSDEIIVLWNRFYLLVQNFRDKTKTTSAYSTIILEKIVNDIYNTNIKLVVEFNKLLEIHNIYFKEKITTYKSIQYTLFFILVMLLIYLFTQLKSVIYFIQKFINTSKNIITNSTIKELQPIEVQHTNNELSQASDNFNFLVKKINNSIQNSSTSIQNSYNQLEQVENNIEDLLELIYAMDNDENIDKELTKKEDAVIQSLEELTSSKSKLKNLKIDLDNLLLQSKLKI